MGAYGSDTMMTRTASDDVAEMASMPLMYVSMLYTHT
jgi:hypothetical protein